MQVQTHIHPAAVFALASLLVLPAAYAADVVVQPSPGSSLVIKDSAGATDRFRVNESGAIAFPSWQSLPTQAAQMCINSTSGMIGPCTTTTGFSLPYAASVSSTATLFDIIQSGSGHGASIGVTNPANTSSALDVVYAGTGYGVNIDLPSSSGGSRAINVQHSGTGPGVFVNTVGGNSIWGITGSMSAAAIIGDSSSGEAIVARQNGAICEGNVGKCVGIGAMVGRHDGAGGYGVRGFVTDATPGFQSIGVLGQSGLSGGIGIAGRFENVNSTNTSNALEVESRSAGNVAFFRGRDGRARIDNTGRGFFDGGTQTGGADVAELINTKGQLPQPGDVVEIDPDHDMHYRLSSKAESTMVAGVITTKPGVLMNAGSDDAAGLPALALVGRVPVKVTLEGGAIRPGDLLVSASIGGHAKRATGEIVPGTVIGKALQSHLRGEKGVVEMLVMTR